MQNKNGRRRSASATTESQTGSTLAFTAVISLFIIIIGIAGIFLAMLLGGSRELKNATNAGTLNVAHNAVSDPHVALTPRDEHFQEYEKINLGNCNEMWSEALVIAMNASAMQGEGASSARESADKVISEANDISGRLAAKLEDQKNLEKHFASIASSNSLRMCGQQAKHRILPGWETACVAAGDASNIKLDGTSYPEGFDRETFEAKALVSGTRYIKGYTKIELPNISKPLFFVPLEPQSQPHLIAAKAFHSAAKKEAFGWSNAVPNSFKTLSEIGKDSAPVKTEAYAIAASLRGAIRPVIKHGFIKITNDAGFNQCIAKNLHAAEYAAHQVVIARAGTGCSGSGSKDCEEGISINIPIMPTDKADWHTPWGIPLLQDDWSWKVVPTEMGRSNGITDYSAQKEYENVLNTQYKEAFKPIIWRNICLKAQAGDVCSYKFQLKHMALGDYPIVEHNVDNTLPAQRLLDAIRQNPGQPINGSQIMNYNRDIEEPLAEWTSKGNGEACSWAKDAMYMMQQDPGGQLMFRPSGPSNWFWHASNGQEWQIGEALGNFVGKGAQWDPTQPVIGNGSGTASSDTAKLTSNTPSGRSHSGIMDLPESRAGQLSDPIRFAHTTTLANVLRQTSSTYDPAALESARKQLLQRIQEIDPSFSPSSLDSLLNTEIPMGATAYIYKPDHSPEGTVMLRLSDDPRLPVEAPWLSKYMSATADGTAQKLFAHYHNLTNTLINVQSDWSTKRPGQPGNTSANRPYSTANQQVYSQDLITLTPATGANKILLSLNLQSFLCSGTTSKPNANTTLSGTQVTFSGPQ